MSPLLHQQLPRNHKLDPLLETTMCKYNVLEMRAIIDTHSLCVVGCDDRYLSVDSNVYTYDLRMATAPIIRQDSRQTLLEASDEINQISTSCRGDLWVSAADDSGTVHLTNPASGKRRILRHDSNNVAIAMSAIFRPKRRDEIASGGTDCTVHLWDVSKPRYV